MGQLVQKHLRPVHALGLGGRIAEEVGVGVRDVAHILHAAPVEFGDKHLVVLGEGIGGPEVIAEEVEAGSRVRKQFVGVEMLEQGRPAPQAERDPVVLHLNTSVGAGHDGQEVGAEGNRRFVVPDGAAFIGHFYARDS